MQTEKEYLIGREIASLRCESTGEYSLPDYNGDVKKILAVKCKAFPSGCFSSDDSLEFSGSVGYDVVYLDSENNITHAEFSTDYESSVRMKAENYVSSDVKTSISSCNLRPLGPRKLSVKCTLENDIRICEKRSYSIEGDAFLEYEPELSTSTANVFRPVILCGEAKEYKEDVMTLEGAIVDEVEILMTEACFKEESINVNDGSLSLEGYVKVNILYSNGDTVPRICEARIPVREDILSDEPYEASSCESRLDISELKSYVTPFEEGVYIGVSLSAKPVVYARVNDILEIAKDAYLKERGTENEYRDFDYTEHILTERCEESFDYRLPFSEVGVESCGQIIWLDASSRVERCDFCADGVKVEGEIRFSAIACQVSEDEKANYFPIKFGVPFVKNVNINLQKHENMQICCSVNATDLKMECTGNEVLASATLLAFVSVNSERRQRCLGRSILTGDEFTLDESVVTVYYPDPSESLFSVAKRFHTSVKKIAETNMLAESVYASSTEPLVGTGVKRLIIK